MKNSLRNNTFTYEDYLKFPEGEKVELIEGQIFAMTPAPSRMHQKLVTEIATVVNSYLKKTNSPCELYVAPFDVRLLENEAVDNSIINVVQPDISVICNKSKLDERGCKGAPDFIVEVVSPGNSSMDYVKKLFLYEKFGVREYWIVNPVSKSILVYCLSEAGTYNEPEKFTGNSKVNVSIFKDFAIDFTSLFDE